MRTTAFALTLALSATLAAAQAPAWNSRAAAAYLDERANWWMDAKFTQRDHDTFCVSCHTTAPYALARPALRGVLAEKAPSANEQRMLDNLRKRVRMWAEVEPFYKGDPKPAESRGTEAIFNALILANTDRTLTPDTKLAFENMWSLQLADGSLNWLDFHNAPWEAPDSKFYGNTLAAIAVGTAPENYRATPAIQEKVKALSAYLSENREKQSLVNRVVLLWASTKLPGLLTQSRQDAIVAEALSKQSEDGSWNLASIVGTWKRHDGTPLDPRGDGYATGLVTYVLQQAGVSCDQAKLHRGLTWLAANQNQINGNWPGYSLNKQREQKHVAYYFMSDAATSYAVLSLTAASH